ncbi:MAG: hypothetical protein MSK32_09015 [Paraprevotella sp.]|nr:hypothetical protein [Paraprevotella sp.]
MREKIKQATSHPRPKEFVVIFELLEPSHWEQNKNQKNPLGRMEGFALMLCFRLGLIRASS